ncbi:hypothetical protein MKK88_19860 [Methylobacterium sp. E-005]|uniref:hypothetical protein n=1 Tax=Methylobacterium sp. E-005 TaxID=2836549 RepID=UPI001FBB5A57|nr:hypothetical protein [Methylobacterium sp. E-005]MCJ2088220.1 hypothetical protein [Methylobacterium sp. E-005]
MTRLLAAAPPTRRSPVERVLPRDDRASMHGALESAVLRGFVYGVSGLVWLVVMLFIARHCLR